MPRFGRSSKDNLNGCDIDLVRVFTEVVKDFDCKVICGHRNEADQKKAFDEKRSKVKFPNSKHNKWPSKAVDVVPYPIDWDTERELLSKYFKAKSDGFISSEEREIIAEAENSLKRWYAFGGYVKGVAHSMEINIRWGGDWDGDFDFKDQTFNDLPHFEIIG